MSTAGLKSSNGQKDKDKKDMSGDNLGDKGGESFSSGSSFVTILSSVSGISDPNDPNGSNGNGNKVDIKTEKWCHTILQVSVPFFIAGAGTIGAGYILNMVKVRSHPGGPFVARARRGRKNLNLT